MARARPQNPNAFFPPQPDNIIESQDIIDIMPHYKRDTWLVLDLDNTIWEPADEHDELGSDQWFMKLWNYGTKVDLSGDNLDGAVLVLAIYHAVQHQVNMQLIQPEAINVIEFFQAMGNQVLFLTARGSEIMLPTKQQLMANGIDTLANSPRMEIVLDIGEKKNPPIYNNNVVYCSGKPKEKCLKALLDVAEAHPNIIYVDDKDKYLHAVGKMVKEYGGQATCLHYRRLDEKVLKHDFQKANRKLEEIRADLPNEAQEALMKLKM